MRGKPPVPRFAHAELGGLPGSPRRLLSSSLVRVGERVGNLTRRVLAKCGMPRSYAERDAEREARELAIGQDIWGAGGLPPTCFRLHPMSIGSHTGGFGATRAGSLSTVGLGARTRSDAGQAPSSPRLVC